MTVLGPRPCARALSSRGKRGPLFIAVRGPLTIAAPPAAEHRLQTRRLSSCGSRAQSLRGTWDPPRPGLEPVSPASAGRFSTTAPPGKPYYLIFGGSNPLVTTWEKICEKFFCFVICLLFVKLYALILPAYLISSFAGYIFINTSYLTQNISSLPCLLRIFS